MRAEGHRRPLQVAQAVDKVTPQGWRFLIDACAVRDEIEGTFEAALGPELMAAFTQAIERLATLGVDVSGTPEPLDLLPS